MAGPVPPDHLDVGPIRFKVLTDKAGLKGWEHELDDSSVGFTEVRAGVIGVANDLCRDAQALVLVHEWLHACAYVAGLTQAESLPLGDDELEEQVVAALAPVVLDSLQRNPELLRFALGRRRGA